MTDSITLDLPADLLLPDGVSGPGIVLFQEIFGVTDYIRSRAHDLADLGFEPVRIEEPEGKAAYVEAQRGFAERGAPLRARLLAECERLLAS